MPAAHVKRTPVPTWASCEFTIYRESRYWSRLSHLLTTDDLVQEGWLIAHKVLRAYDPTRNCKLETLLTLAIRRQFARLFKRTLQHAFIYTERQGVDLRNHIESTQQPLDVQRALDAWLMMACFERMSAEDQSLAWDIVELGHKIRHIAKRRAWSVPFTKERIAQLRRVLKESV